ncbi:MAG TPA: double-strand break repair helicase AddA [Bauldia sp.]|nr:double-strand break repair helicase AddA [Bauldia sp.]
MVRSAQAVVDKATEKAQAAASNPRGSAWVSANAGSGKTYVLAQRVIRLLLAGADPSRILCLTFTRAAAAEMAKRVFDILSNWTALSDTRLAGEIARIEGKRPDAATLAQGRRLFARALETPGGLKIQTIHAFCERLLHQFPFEANVAGNFEVLAERDQAALAETARRRTLAKAANDGDGPLGRALGTVLAAASDFMHELAVKEFIDKRDRVRAWIAAAGSLDDALLELRSALGVSDGESVASLRSAILGECALASQLAALAEVLAGGSKADRQAAERLARVADARNQDDRIDAYLEFWIRRTDGELRVARSMVTNAMKARWEGLEEWLELERERLDGLLQRLRAADCYESTAAILVLADAAIAEYDRMKTLRGALDFEDLIVKTVGLLSRIDASRWVHYKLDRGLDHILVDEAQDTSPRQWQVIRALAEEFFAGDGASNAVRTLFAVGDEKQSIFSFQGAVPAWFSRMRRELGARARRAGYPWADPELHLSFRSVPVILEAVDAVFAEERAWRGLSGEGGAPSHTAQRQGEPGRVILWPMIPAPERSDPPDWTTPVDHLGAKSPEVRLAERIASTIDGWIKRAEPLESTSKPIRPRDILILSRTRGAQTDAINRALKSRGVPIAGADRLKLTEHIAVMDLMALSRVMLLPEDDLSLAALLKSPLVGLDEDQLFAIAQGRGRTTLWWALGEAAVTRGGAFAQARRRLDEWRIRAGRLDPYAFYAGVLGADGGRHATLRRLGPEAEDVLDEFLAQALAYEETNAPSLQGFLAWLEAADTDIRRDTESTRDEVRVMTVHGAKGLEADIVFLVDTGALPVHPNHDPRIVALREDRDGTPAPLVWMRRYRSMPLSVKRRVDALRAEAEEEYRRLLYVGLTRARDRLYICGTEKQISERDKPKRWHNLVTAALGGECVRREDAGGEILEWRPGPPAAVIAKGRQEAMSFTPPRPDWLARRAPPPPPAVRRITPSTALAPDTTAASVRTSLLLAGADVRQAAERGRLIHRLLESLPEMEPSLRRERARSYLDAVAPEWEATERAAVVDNVIAVLEHPDFAAVFAPGSRAEVEISGRIGSSVLSGRLDRLAIAADRVLIVDYKTNRPAPATPAEAPHDYVMQLALYRAVLRRLYPHKPVSAAILWTDRPAIMEIPSAVLDAAESEAVDATHQMQGSSALGDGLSP